jgi:hypothetical protein
MSDTTPVLTAAAAPRSWLFGLPHGVVGAAAWPVFGGPACITGILLAALVSFVVFLPLTALALNRGRPIPADATAPALTPLAYTVLLLLWSGSVWSVAALAAG